MNEMQTTEAVTIEQAPATPQATGVWPIPTETSAVLRDLDMACATVLQKIGDNEINYLAQKTMLMEDLRKRRTMFKQLLDDAARKAGLDIDKQNWTIDMRTMVLTRTS